MVTFENGEDAQTRPIVVNGVIKGVWNPVVKSKIKNLGIELCDSRKSLSFFETIKYQIRYFQFDVYTYLIHIIY